ncbi:MAG: PQQ-binding-like beta-propeller repeat protein [Actinomycetota bacterium]|nr:PQQ-binding-like beta-propeller repeat protein [Actinomycetota bacterium]
MPRVSRRTIGYLVAAVVLVLVAVGVMRSLLRDPQRSPGQVALPTGTASASQPRSWWTYHRDNTRSGDQPGIAAVHRLLPAWQQHLDGAVYASPLVVGHQVILATENNTVYSLDLGTGRQSWRHHLGTPVSGNLLPCGNVNPLGITGTPTYDRRTQRIYAVTETVRRGRVRHDLVGVDVQTGRMTFRQNADPPRQDPVPMQQRGALLALRGVIYVPYGGLYGDCGDYHGHVVAIDPATRRAMSVYRVPAARKGGIWAPPGVVQGTDGRLLAAVGNGSSSTSYDGSDSVIALDPHTLTRLDFFAPRNWRSDNRVDADLGSMGPVVLPDGGTLAAGKSGYVYLLGKPLGGIGGEVASVRGCVAFGGAAVAGMRVFLPCIDGVRELMVTQRSLSFGWRANQASGSPVLGGGKVWSLNTATGMLYAFDQRDGQITAQASVGPVTRFATPALTRDRVVVPTRTGVVVLSIS